MAKRTEILEYKAEVADAKRDIADLGETEERSIGKGSDAVKEATSVTEEFTKQKGRLGAAVRAVGGQFSGLIGDLGGVVELFRNGGRAAVAFAGALAGLAVATGIFRKISEAAREAKAQVDALLESQRQLRDESLSAQQQMGEMLRQAGVFGGAGQAVRSVYAFMARGIPQQVAMFGATAGAVGTLSAEQMRQAMAGFVYTGETAAFTGDQAANQRLIEDMLRAGATREARAALAGRMRDVGELAQREAGRWRWQAPTTIAEDTAFTRFAEAQQLTADDIRRVKLMLSLGTGASREEMLEEAFAGELGGGIWALSKVGVPLESLIGGRQAPGGSRTASGLAQLAATFERDQGQFYTPAPAGAPITINVQNIGQQVGVRGDPHLSPFRPSAPGDGLKQRGPE